MHREQHREAAMRAPLSAPTDPACSLGFPRGEKATTLTGKTLLWGWRPMEGS